MPNNSDPWKRELIQRFPNCAKVEGLLWIGVTRDQRIQIRLDILTILGFPLFLRFLHRSCRLRITLESNMDEICRHSCSHWSNTDQQSSDPGGTHLGGCPRPEHSVGHHTGRTGQSILAGLDPNKQNRGVQRVAAGADRGDPGSVQHGAGPRIGALGSPRGSGASGPASPHAGPQFSTL